MDWLTDPNAWIALVTLTVLEIVLGIDNIIFISIQAGKLPREQQNRGRVVGLALAMLLRVCLLLVIDWITSLTAPLFTILEQEISGRDIILIAGGLFLIAKSTREIHHKIEDEPDVHVTQGAPSFASVIVQILLLDIVFSLDSVITAVGMADEVLIMIIAVVLAVGFMMFAARPVSAFVERHPTVKMLALSFLLLIGVALIADGLELHIPKGYIYFAMAFSVFVEMLNLRMSRKRKERDAKQEEPAGVGSPTPAS